MKGRRVKVRSPQFSKISREADYSVDVSRTIGWTLMDREGPDESEAGTAAFLPATVKN